MIFPEKRINYSLPDIKTNYCKEAPEMIYLSRVRNYLPAQGKGIRLGVYQGECPVGTKEAVQANLTRLETVAEDAAGHGVQLLSFPELYITGYALNPPLVKELAESVDGLSMQRVAATAKANKLGIICPYPEKAGKSGETVYYDSIAMFGPDGELLLNYRKVHLFGQAERDNYISGYDENNADELYKVVKVFGFPVGILNCYEAEFPELSRILALRGAKLIVIPTAADYFYTLANGKMAEVPYPDATTCMIPAHAYGNHVFIAYSNRCGWEEVDGKSWEYRGNSVICGPHGKHLVAALPEETMLIADIVPEDFGRTHPEGDYLEDRLPQTYRILTENITVRKIMLNIYAAKWCPHCRKSISYLKEHNIEFNYVEIEEQPEEVINKIVEVNGGDDWVVPTFELDGKWRPGKVFNAEELRRDLEEMGIKFQ